MTPNPYTAGVSPFKTDTNLILLAAEAAAKRQKEEAAAALEAEKARRVDEAKMDAMYKGAAPSLSGEYHPVDMAHLEQEQQGLVQDLAKMQGARINPSDWNNPLVQNFNKRLQMFQLGQDAYKQKYKDFREYTKKVQESKPGTYNEDLDHYANSYAEYAQLDPRKRMEYNYTPPSQYRAPMTEDQIIERAVKLTPKKGLNNDVHHGYTYDYTKEVPDFESLSINDPEVKYALEKMGYDTPEKRLAYYQQLTRPHLDPNYTTKSPGDGFGWGSSNIRIIPTDASQPVAGNTSGGVFGAGMYFPVIGVGERKGGKPFYFDDIAKMTNIPTGEKALPIILTETVGGKQVTRVLTPAEFHKLTEGEVISGDSKNIEYVPREEVLYTAKTGGSKFRTQEDAALHSTVINQGNHYGYKDPTAVGYVTGTIGIGKDEKAYISVPAEYFPEMANENNTSYKFKQATAPATTPQEQKPVTKTESGKVRVKLNPVK